MRICPVSKVRYLSSNSRLKSLKSSSKPHSEVSFQAGGVKWGGAIGSIVGTFAGFGLGTLATIATGGLAVPLILGMAGAAVGGIGGDTIDSKIRKSYPHDDESEKSCSDVDADDVKWS